MSKILNISRDVLQKQGGTTYIDPGWGNSIRGPGGSLRLLILQSLGLVLRIDFKRLVLRI